MDTDASFTKQDVSGLIVAAEIAERCNGLILLNEAWTSPLSGFYTKEGIYKNLEFYIQNRWSRY